MTNYLYGIHDFDPAWATILSGQGKPGWCVTTHALGTDRNDRSGYDYSPLVAYSVTPLARLNNGYNPVGTIPLPQDYPAFAERCANFVSGSKNCIRWIIGNEPNLRIERPNDTPITAQQYAQCFVMCRNMIKQRGLQHQVGVAAIGPWNAQTGPWIQYWQDVLGFVAANGGADFLTFHTYTRTPNPADITSDAKMKADGYTNFYANFLAYRDFMNAIPQSMRHLAVHGTETDEILGWTDGNTGVVKAMYAEIHSWNRTPGNQPIQSLSLFRWPKGAEYGVWGIEGKNGVIQDFKEAVALGYLSPNSGAASQEEENVEVPVIDLGPSIPPGPSAPGLETKIDPRLTARGVVLTPAPVLPGQGRWRVKEMRWYNEEEADRIGPDHHILGEIRKGATRAVDVPLRVTWGGGSDQTTQIKSKLNPADAFNYDFAMTKSLHEFSLRVDDGNPSDNVSGIGMGVDGNSGVHTSTWIDWEWALAIAGSPAQPVPPVDAGSKMYIPLLVHPIADPALRLVSERFGEDADYYKQYAVDGVALKGHNGIDFAVPTSTPVRAVADGVVREAWFEPGGYGNLILLDHPWGQSLYAHLDGRNVEPGDTVIGGEIIARSGATGKVTGPHLHFGMRVFPFARTDGWGGYSDPAPYLANLAGTSGSTPPAPVRTGLIDPMTAAAILAVESNGVGFGPDGRMTIRFEPHIFKPAVDAAVFAEHFQIGDPIWDGAQHRFKDPADGQWKRFHGDQGMEYKALAEANKINPEAALDATSMGMAQVMGFNAERIGFTNAQQMYQLLRGSAQAQMMAFVNFVLTDDTLRQAMADKNFEKVAVLYNGVDVEEYAARMRDAYAELIQ